MSYVDIALKILKDNGYKHTKTRQKVLEILDKYEEALSPYEISDKSNNCTNSSMENNSFSL